ncbi:hypothetical protein SGPA1_12558 [Streptomyces misionensis JCM 4497]
MSPTYRIRPGARCAPTAAVAAGGQRGESVRGPAPGVEQKVAVRGRHAEDRPGRGPDSDPCSRLDPSMFSL